MSGGGDRSEGEGASEGGKEGGRRKGGGNRGEEGRRPAPPIARSCKRAPGAFPGAPRCVRAPLCSSGGGGPRGRKGGGRGRGAASPLKTACKVLWAAEAGRGIRGASRSSRGSASARGCWAAPRLLVGAGALCAGLGLTMPLRGRAAGHQRIPGLPPPRRARISCSQRPRI